MKEPTPLIFYLVLEVDFDVLPQIQLPAHFQLGPLEKKELKWVDIFVIKVKKTGNGMG
jgi:hypothetical protein